MRIKTSFQYNTIPDILWPLLFSSKMDSRQPCYFLCGLPKPVECRLKDGEGGVGKTRECVSDKGVIKQNILEWEPNKKLKFELVETDIYFGPCVESIVECFEIKVVSEFETAITRETIFVLRSSFKYILFIPMFIGLKSIHRYVFANWRRILKENAYSTM